jgi:hypothetical protein
MKKIKHFIIHWFAFKPLYKLEKLIDPMVKVGKPKYPKFSFFVYKIAKSTIF